MLKKVLQAEGGKCPVEMGVCRCRALETDTLWVNTRNFPPYSLTGNWPLQAKPVTAMVGFIVYVEVRYDNSTKSGSGEMEVKYCELVTSGAAETQW